MLMPLATPMILASEKQSRLESCIRAYSTPQALALRCWRILGAAAPDHPANLQVVTQLHGNRHTVGCGRHRCLQDGLSGLQDVPRPGWPRRFSPCLIGSEFM